MRKYGSLFIDLFFLVKNIKRKTSHLLTTAKNVLAKITHIKAVFFFELHQKIIPPKTYTSLLLGRRACGHVDMGMGPHQVLAITLTLSQPGGRLCPHPSFESHRRA